MTEKWGQIQGKWELVLVSGAVRVIRVRVTRVLLYRCVIECYENDKNLHVVVTVKGRGHYNCLRLSVNINEMSYMWTAGEIRDDDDQSQWKYELKQLKNWKNLKNSGLNGIRTQDPVIPVIPVQRCNKLSYISPSWGLVICGFLLIRALDGE